MRLNEFTDIEDKELPFDIVDDTIVFMRNDPMFYRRHYFPAVSKLGIVNNILILRFIIKP